jgi:transposase-like protein
MSKTEARSFSRAFKLDVVRRMEAGENVSALSREVGVKREVLYRWRDAWRLGGEAALRLKGRPSKADAVAMRLARGVAGKADDLAEARWQIDQLQRKVGRQQLDLDFFKQALRRIEASRRPSDRSGATASSPTSKR